MRPSGKTATYWVSNDRCVWYMDYRTVDGADGAYLKEDRFNYNGFCPVRGIKMPNNKVILQILRK